MKIYTKTGDSGSTSLVGGTRVSKADYRLDIYGTIDELNAHIGLAMAHHVPEKDRVVLDRIQHELFQVGFVFSTDWTRFDARQHVLPETAIDALETEIDLLQKGLPELREFIMPGGHLLAAQLHVARTVCRRAERLAVMFLENLQIPDLENQHQQLDMVWQSHPEARQLSEIENATRIALSYLNRLSDYLFVLSRTA